MIQAGFFSVFNYIANNRWAQIALTAGAIVFFWLMNNRHQRKVGARQSDARHREASIQKDLEIREQSDEAVEAADTVRVNTRRVRSTRVRGETSLPDYHYRD